MVFKLPSTFSNWLDLLPSPTHIRCHGLYYFWSWSSLKTNVIIYCQALIALTENDAPARFSVCHSGNICTSRYHNTYFAPQHQHTSTYIRVLCWGQVRVARPRGGVSEILQSPLLTFSHHLLEQVIPDGRLSHQFVVVAMFEPSSSNMIALCHCCRNAKTML